jgi:hypothetical protein
LRHVGLPGTEQAVGIGQDVERDSLKAFLSAMQDMGDDVEGSGGVVDVERHFGIAVIVKPLVKGFGGADAKGRTTGEDVSTRLEGGVVQAHEDQVGVKTVTATMWVGRRRLPQVK